MTEIFETLSESLKILSGTPEGYRLAAVLAVLSAFFHAVLGAINKGSGDPMLTRGGIDISYGLLATPIALFIVPWPEGDAALLLALGICMHFCYKLCLTFAYQRGAYTVVFPISRGISPLIIALLGGVVFAEHFSAGQWIGLLILSCSIFSLSWVNIRQELQYA